MPIDHALTGATATDPASGNALEHRVLPCAYSLAAECNQCSHRSAQQVVLCLFFPLLFFEIVLSAWSALEAAVKVMKPLAVATDKAQKDSTHLAHALDLVKGFHTVVFIFSINLHRPA